MLRDILNFFKQEKMYAILFLIVTAYLVSLWIFRAPAPAEPATAIPQTSAYDDFRKIEERFQAQIRKAESFENFLSQNPDIKQTYEILFQLSGIIFMSGILITILWMTNVRFRRWATRSEALPQGEWKFSMLFKAILLFFAVAIPLGILVSLLEQFWFPQVSPHWYTLLHTTVVDLVCILFIFWSIANGGGNIRGIGFPASWKEALKDIAVGWAGYAALIPVFILILMGLVFLSQLFHYEPPPHPLVHVFLEEERKSPWIIGYSLFLAAFLGPILEEIFFRGYLYPILKKKMGMLGGMIVSSLIFASIHMNEFAFLPIFILGMGLVYIYEMRKSVFAPIALHVTHNSIFIYYFFVMKDIVVAHSGA